MNDAAAFEADRDDLVATRYQLHPEPPTLEETLDRAETAETYAEQLQNDLATARERIRELEHQLAVARQAAQKRVSW